MATNPFNPNDLVRDIVETRYGGLERRVCTADAPMQAVDKDRYRWGHPDAVEVQPYFNLVLCHCPHCDLSFTCLPREESTTP